MSIKLENVGIAVRDIDATIAFFTDLGLSVKDLDPAELATLLAAVDEFNTALKSSGALLFAGGLNPPSTAKTVDVTSGETQVLDEPFVEAESYVGGFWVIEAADEAAALEWSTKASVAVQCRIEVRALQEAPEA